MTKKPDLSFRAFLKVFARVIREVMVGISGEIKRGKPNKLPPQLKCLAELVLVWVPVLIIVGNLTPLSYFLLIPFILRFFYWMWRCEKEGRGGDC